MADQEGVEQDDGEPPSSEKLQDQNETVVPPEEIPEVLSNSEPEELPDALEGLIDEGLTELLQPSTSQTKKQKTDYLKSNATVKFVLMPSGQVVTMACVLDQPLWEMKVQFAGELQIPVDYLQLVFNGQSLTDKTVVADLGVSPCGTVQLELHSTDSTNHPIRPYKPHYEYQMPDIIAVRVKTGSEEEKQVVVEIERATVRKPYLGGFWNRFTGTEYHNASMQAPRILRVTYDLNSRFCRDSQTTELRHLSQQTFTDASTQMTGVGVYVSNMEDKLLEPKGYTSADDYLASILEKVMILQKNYRRWLAVRRVNRLKEARRKYQEWEKEQECLKKEEVDSREGLELQRRMYPRTKEDFDLLYAALERWRLQELERINRSLTGAERKAALYMLLLQETDLLAAIDRHQMESGIENSRLHIQNFLNKAAAPLRWRRFDGLPVEMSTPFTLRAKDLRDIYNSLTAKYFTPDERLDILLTLKHTVEEHKCKLTKEIIELIDREADLLMRRVKEENLMGLRKRIATLFLQYIKTPTFNPEVAKILKVPQDPTKLRKNIYLCSSCNKYLPCSEFNLSTNSRTPGNCRSCMKLDNDARTRLDLSHFRMMLEALRVAERGYEDGSQYAFLLQEKDLRYLVEFIWNGQSILSAKKNLYDLVLVRWDKNIHWSPWNCILLTQEEAKSHDKITNLQEAYEEVFIHRVSEKHTWARNYFSKLSAMVKMINRDKRLSLSPDPSFAARNLISRQTQTTS